MLTIISPIFLLALWELLSRTGMIDVRFFPPPSAIIGTFWQMLTSGVMASHIGVSLYRIFAGFLAGVIPGVVIGLLMGLYSPIRHFVSPIVMALMPIPTLALLPIIIILFGIGDLSKVVTIAGSVFSLSSSIQQPASSISTRSTLMWHKTMELADGISSGRSRCLAPCRSCWKGSKWGRRLHF